jgi:hypothetical protein
MLPQLELNLEFLCDLRDDTYLLLHTDETRANKMTHLAEDMPASRILLAPLFYFLLLSNL